VAHLRQRVAEAIDHRALPRLDGARIGVVTGAAMGTRIMPGILDRLTEATGARFELLVMENSLFGPTTTTAGLLVGADIRRALARRNDLDVALIPAETINDDGVFLDDTPFEALAGELPVPVHPSYDFVDVLQRDGLLAAAAR